MSEWASRLPTRWSGWTAGATGCLGCCSEHGSDGAEFDNEFMQRNTTIMTGNLMHMVWMLMPPGSSTTATTARLRQQVAVSPVVV